MMKKGMALLLAALLLLAGAAAEEKASGMLEANEVQAVFSDKLNEMMLSDEVEVWDEEGTVRYGLPGTVMTLAEGDDLTPDAEVLSVMLTGNGDARGVLAGDPAENVLKAYPCDNPTLRGTEYAALLYMRGDLNVDGTVLTGYCARGEEGYDLSYLSLTAAEDGKTVFCFGVRYEIVADRVDAAVYFKNTMDRAEADALLDELAESQETGAFEPAAPVPAAELPAFCEEDLIFSGISMTAGTPEDLLALFGSADVDTRVADTDELELRVMQWENIEAVAVYGADGAFEKLYSLRVTGSEPAGPRGIACGDSLARVLARFRCEEETGALYGNGTDLPYGVLTAADGSVLVRYAAQAGEEQATLALRFEEGVLREMLITLD